MDYWNPPLHQTNPEVTLQDLWEWACRGMRATAPSPAIRVSTKLSRQVRFLMWTAQMAVNVNSWKTRENETIWRLNQVVEHHPEA